MRVAAYIRVSTDEQAEKGNSISEQKERLTAYCTAMEWDAPVFFTDDGYSAKNLKRPYIKKMIESVERGEFDIVLTAKLDRLCRNLLDLLQLVDLLEQHKCNYVSSSERFDTSTAVGLMTLQLLGTFAEFERGRNSERVKDNMTSIARNTDKVLSQACYGYDLEDSRYKINDLEARNVIYMFELAEQGNGHRMIAKKLNDKGITTKRGHAWDQINVKRIMQNETLSGVMIYNKRQVIKGKMSTRSKADWIIKEDNHPAIISPERFREVQNIFNSRSRAHKHADNESYLLTGLVKCKYCGGGMKGSTSRNKTKYGEYTYYRYICSSYVLGYGCKHHAVHRDDLEKWTIGRVRAILDTSDAALEIAVSHSTATENDIKEIKLQLSKVNKRMQKQIEAYENDLISGEDLRSARLRVESERIHLNGQLEKLEALINDGSSVKKNAARLIDDITGDDRLKAKLGLRALISSILVEGPVANIVWIP